MKINEMKLTTPAKSVNESFVRSAVASFALQLDPTLQELSEIKTAVSEAVTNAAVHAYEYTTGNVYITASVTDGNMLIVRVKDRGRGIADIAKAMEPLYTTGGEERSGLGFSVMECFSDKLKVSSKEGCGTSVTIYKRIKGKSGA